MAKPATATTELSSSLELFYRWERERTDNNYLNQPVNGTWKRYTWGEFGQEVRKMATYLRAQGLAPGDRIAIMSKNCAHWLMSDLAILLAGYISVPLYPNISAENVAYILKHSEAKLLFVGKLDVHNWDIMKQGVPADLPCITYPDYGQPEYPNWDEVTHGLEPFMEDRTPSLDEVMTIIYTSGTTGTPKGVVHKFRGPSFAINELKGLIDLTEKDRFFSYLPLSHIAERMLVEMGTLTTGATIHFAESLDTFADNLKECSPTIFLGVPRIWTKFMQGVLAKFPPSRLKLVLSIPIINSMIKKKIREALGLKDARICLTGAAPMPVSMLEWYKNLDIMIHEVYGMTENCAYSHTNLPGATKFGTVGQTLREVTMKFTDEGEICLKCLTNMVEYYKEPEKTVEALQDGYLHTGDVGELDADGYLHITGRTKDIFKTSKAKYVAPNPIEQKLATNELIEQVCVVGNGIPQPIALLVLGEAGQGMDKQAVDSSLGETLKSVNTQLEHHEQLQKLVVLSDTWTPENGLLTPTLKIKRAEVDKQFSKNYEAWYEGGKGVVFA